MFPQKALCPSSPGPVRQPEQLPHPNQQSAIDSLLSSGTFSLFPACFQISMRPTIFHCGKFVCYLSSHTFFFCCQELIIAGSIIRPLDVNCINFLLLGKTSIKTISSTVVMPVSTRCDGTAINRTAINASNAAAQITCSAPRGFRMHGYQDRTCS